MKVNFAVKLNVRSVDIRVSPSTHSWTYLYPSPPRKAWADLISMTVLKILWLQSAWRNAVTNAANAKLLIKWKKI